MLTQHTTGGHKSLGQTYKSAYRFYKFNDIRCFNLSREGAFSTTQVLQNVTPFVATATNGGSLPNNHP